MGVFSRLRDIINSNINSMLEKAEDPEKMVKLMIQEMEDTLIEIKASCAGAMAQAKKVSRELEYIEGKQNKWAEKAKLAVEKGREDLARDALREKKSCREQAEALEAEVSQFDEIVEQYRKDIEQLEEKLQAAREKHRILVQRHKRATDQKRTQTQIRKAGNNDTFVRFQQFENRIERLESEAELVNYGVKGDLEQEIAKLGDEDEIEDELRKLKDSVGGSESQAS